MPKVHLIFSNFASSEIGTVLLLSGLTLYCLGILFLFDRTCFVLANMSFIGGIVLFIGLTRTIGFFFKKGKRFASGIFFLGFFMIAILRFSFIGFCLQAYSLFVLFRSFFPALYNYLYSVGPIANLLSSPTAQPFFKI